MPSPAVVLLSAAGHLQASRLCSGLITRTAEDALHRLLDAVDACSCTVLVVESCGGCSFGGSRGVGARVQPSVGASDERVAGGAATRAKTGRCARSACRAKPGRAAGGRALRLGRLVPRRRHRPLVPRRGRSEPGRHQQRAPRLCRRSAPPRAAAAAAGSAAGCGRGSFRSGGRGSFPGGGRRSCRGSGSAIGTTAGEDLAERWRGAGGPGGYCYCQDL